MNNVGTFTEAISLRKSVDENDLAHSKVARGDAKEHSIL
jgi:hypothetical protein